MAKNESMENYLETILILRDKLPVVRSVDIANELGFKKSSISVAVKNMKEKDYIRIDKYGYIQLTEAGLEIAEMIYERHQFLTNWLSSIGVDPEIAANDACKLEHDLSVQSFEAIKRYINKKDSE